MPSPGVTLTVYDTTPAEAQVIVAELGELMGEAERAAIRLGRPYVLDWGYAEDVADRLIKGAPCSAWQVWQGPTDEDEGLGWLIRYTPTLGTFKITCDGEGDPCLSGDLELRELLDMGREQAGRAIGEPWATAFVAWLSRQDDEVVVPAPAPPVVEQPPPVDVATVAGLAHRMHEDACRGSRWRDEPTDAHAALYLAAAQVVVDAGWRPWSGDRPA